MSTDKSAVIVNSQREPKYRADSIEWFYDPACTSIINFRGPDAVYEAIEQAAERADRSFNDQILLILRACRGEQVLYFADTRSLKEWRDLMGQMNMQFNEGEEWIPCSAIFPNAGR